MFARTWEGGEVMTFLQHHSIIAGTRSFSIGLHTRVLRLAFGYPVPLEKLTPRYVLWRPNDLLSSTRFNFIRQMSISTNVEF